MRISEVYEELMEYNNLPERFRRGDFDLLQEESQTLREFIDDFFDAAEKNGNVSLEDFVEFMGFLQTLWDVDSEEVKNILTIAFMKSAKMGNALIKQAFPGR